MVKARTSMNLYRYKSFFENGAVRRHSRKCDLGLKQCGDNEKVCTIVFNISEQALRYSKTHKGETASGTCNLPATLNRAFPAM